jgi:ribosomal protein L12E/L44/L45/RPP1/RPP2
MAETTDVNVGTEATGTVTSASTTSNDAKSVSELPKWAQDELTRARNDAASYRTRLRETETARDGLQASLNTEEQKAKALEVEVGDLKVSNTKLDVALEAHVGDKEKAKIKAFADRLRGATPEELVADGKSMMETFGVAPSSTKRATDRSAGLGNENETPTAEDAWANLVGKTLKW